MLLKIMFLYTHQLLWFEHAYPNPLPIIKIQGYFHSILEPDLNKFKFNFEVRVAGILDNAEDKEGKYFHSSFNTSLFSKEEPSPNIFCWKCRRETTSIGGTDPLANMMSDRPSIKFKGLFCTNVELVIHSLNSTMIGAGDTRGES